VRVVLPDGQQLGIMSSREALQKAKLVGLDLVEIAAKADPPVCRIIDYGKFKYEQAKLKKQQKTSKNATRLKEVKFRPRTEQHDYNIKLGRVETFLDEGHKTRIVLQFRGRENAHREVGFEKMQRIIKDVETMAQVDQPPRLSGRVIAMSLTPLPKEQRKRKFHMFHGELLDEDDFEEENEDDEEAVAVTEEAGETSEETPSAESEADDGDADAETSGENAKAE
jgi:translation initiation factor IF-3